MVEFNGYRSDRLEFDELEDDVFGMMFKGVNSLVYNVNGRFLDYLFRDFLDILYENLGIDEKIYMEVQFIGICLEFMVYFLIFRSLIILEMLFIDVFGFGF